RRRIPLVLAMIWQRKLASSRLFSLRSYRNLADHEFPLLCFFRFETLPAIWSLGFGISSVGVRLSDISCGSSRRRFATPTEITARELSERRCDLRLRDNT